MEITLRPQRITDAERMYELLNNPNFKHGPPCPESVEAEREWLRKSEEKRKQKKEFNYAIIYEGEVVGGAGITICKDDYVAEIGYFVGEPYWGKGIAPLAVKTLEKIAFKDLGIVRLEIVVHTQNAASKRVAEKCGYTLEGICRKRIVLKDKYHDACLYAKTT